MASIGTDVYALSGSDNRIYHIQDKSYVYNNLVIIAQSRYYVAGYKTKLLNTEFDGIDQPIYWFVDAWYYTLQDGLQKTVPTYYGDGTQWINFKNPPSNNN